MARECRIYLHIITNGMSCQIFGLARYTAYEMKKSVVLDKKVGETPLAAIRAWKVKNPEYVNIVACYAGRLDPMASGKLLVLFGKECKRLRRYTGLDKEYEIEILLDVRSDTGDVLGIPEYATKETFVGDAALKKILRAERGNHLRAYPAFSSKTVNGKPLFMYALEGSLSNIEMPKHFERIYRMECIESYHISRSNLETKIMEFLALVPRTNEPSKRLGDDFRVDTIRARWESLFKVVPERDFIVLRLKVICASGTYMRSLAGRIGASLGSKALALSIRRTKIGKYVSLWGGAGFWMRTF